MVDYVVPHKELERMHTENYGFGLSDCDKCRASPRDRLCEIRLVDTETVPTVADGKRVAIHESDLKRGSDES